MHPDGITEAVHAAVPEMLDHFLRADDPVAVKQEMYSRSALSFLVRARVCHLHWLLLCVCQGNAAASQADILLDKFTAGEAADSGFQFLEMKWLGKVIVGSQIQTFHLILDLYSCGEYENRSIGIEGTELTQNVQTVNSRQVQIQKNQIVILCHT